MRLIKIVCVSAVVIVTSSFALVSPAYAYPEKCYYEPWHGFDPDCSGNA